MNKASSAARAARRNEEWRRANARLFADNLESQLMESLDYAVAGAIASETLNPSDVLWLTQLIENKLKLGDDYASIEMERATLDATGDHIEASQRTTYGALPVRK